jgi:hypothetical protein
MIPDMEEEGILTNKTAKVRENQQTKILIDDSQLDVYLNRECEEIIKKFKESKSVEEAKIYLVDKLSRYSSKNSFN